MSLRILFVDCPCTLLGKVLADAPRLGAEEDVPEGARYIQISDTLALSLADALSKGCPHERREIRTARTLEEVRQVLLSGGGIAEALCLIQEHIDEKGDAVDNDRPSATGEAIAERCELRRALERIRALDFDKTAEGSNDLYSGPSRFVRAWLIADKALTTKKPRCPHENSLCKAKNVLGSIAGAMGLRIETGRVMSVARQQEHFREIKQFFFDQDAPCAFELKARELAEALKPFADHYGKIPEWMRNGLVEHPRAEVIRANGVRRELSLVSVAAFKRAAEVLSSTASELAAPDAEKDALIATLYAALTRMQHNSNEALGRYRKARSEAIAAALKEAANRARISGQVDGNDVLTAKELDAMADAALQHTR